MTTPPDATPGVPPGGPVQAAAAGVTEFKFAGAPAWHKYRKFAIALLGLAITIALQFAPQSHYTTAAVAIATAFGVWRVPNAA